MQSCSSSSWALILVIFILSCSRKDVVLVREGGKDNLVVNISAGENTQSNKPIKLSNKFGHVVINVSEKDQESVKFRSLQQPDAQMQILSGGQIALLNLHPQNHILMATLQQNNEQHHAVFKDLEIRENSYLELGEPPFQKSGTLQGRLLSVIDSLPQADIRLYLKHLDFEVKTKSDGTFVFPNLPAGRWSFVVAAPDLGQIIFEDVEVVSNKSIDLGDLWIGAFDSEIGAPQLLNGEDGILKEREAKLKLHLPSRARYISIRSDDGRVLLPPMVSRQYVTLPLQQSGRITLNILIYDSNMRILGVQTLPVHFDPFSSDGVAFNPRVSIAQRVIVSPELTFSIELLNIPSRAKAVRFAVDGKFGSWRLPENAMNLALPKSNLMCGQRMISIQYQGNKGELSATSSIPVTVSCWERIPHRADLENLMGLDNAAVWTGTHAFVWSGRQFDTQNRGEMWGGSNSAETVDFQENAQKYIFSDAGYVFQPQINPATGALARSRMELIVTDNAPSPRISAGIGGLNNFVAVYGGEDDNGPLADGAIFDIGANGWVSMMGEGAPSPRIKPSVVFVDANRILVWGGMARTNLGYELPLADGAIYNRITHEWTQISNENAPRARAQYVGVWTGTEFFVVGGRVPGTPDTQEYTSGAFSPATNSWRNFPALTPPSDPTLKIPFLGMSAVYHENHILFFGRNNSLINVYVGAGEFLYRESFTIGLGDWKWNPTMVVGDYLAQPSKKMIYVFGGTASQVSTNITNNQVLLLEVFKWVLNGEVNLSVDYVGQTSGTPVFSTVSAASTGQSVGTCCSDLLGFNFAGLIFALNGTEVSHTSAFTDVAISTNAQNVMGSTVETINAIKSSRGNRFFRLDADFSFPNYVFDSPTRDNTSGTSPLGPYVYSPATVPVWDQQSGNLIMNGGTYRSPYNLRYVDNGYFYNLPTRSWGTIPIAPTEPSFDQPGTGIFHYTRYNPLNFILDGVFYVIGGTQYPSTGPVRRYDGLRSAYSAGTFATPTPILATAEDQKFDFSSFDGGMDNARWISQPPCVGQSQVLLTGGWRRNARGVLEIDDSKALVQEKVVFDKETETLTQAPADPLGVRAGSTVVSTGQECLVWGGYTADGAAYNADTPALIENLMAHFVPKADGAVFSFNESSWRTVSSINSPMARAFMHGVWTGREALLWGGSSLYSPSVSSSVEAGKGVWLYSPTDDFWTHLPSSPGEPPFNGYERPVWTGKHMFIWKSESVDHNYLFTPETNTWSKLPLPYGFQFRQTNSGDAYVVQTGGKVFISVAKKNSMAIFVPPDP